MAEVKDLERVERLDELSRGLSQLVINRQNAMQMSGLNLARRVYRRANIALMTADCIVTQIRKRYWHAYLPTNEDNSSKRLKRLAVILDVLEIDANSPEIRNLKVVYRDQFIYPPEDAASLICGAGI